MTDLQGTQIQRKLGPYIDTFLTSKLLAELDGNMGDAQANARVRQSLEKCVAKIEKNQLKDGSWNIAGGWAPILGTSHGLAESVYRRSKRRAGVSSRPWPRSTTIRSVRAPSRAAGVAAPARAAASAGAIGGGTYSDQRGV